MDFFYSNLFSYVILLVLFFLELCPQYSQLLYSSVFTTSLQFFGTFMFIYVVRQYSDFVCIKTCVLLNNYIFIKLGFFFLMDVMVLDGCYMYVLNFIIASYFLIKCFLNFLSS